MELLSHRFIRTVKRARALIWSFTCPHHSWRRHNGSLFHRFGPFCRQERRSCFGHFPNGRCAVVRTRARTRAQTRGREVNEEKSAAPRPKTLSPETQRCKDWFGFNAALWSHLEVSSFGACVFVRAATSSRFLRAPSRKLKRPFRKTGKSLGREHRHAAKTNLRKWEAELSLPEGALTHFNALYRTARE